MSTKGDILDAAVFAAHRAQLLKFAEQTCKPKIKLESHFQRLLYLLNPTVNIYFQLVLAGKNIPVELVVQVNRALTGYIYSADLIDQELGEDTLRFPVFVSDGRFTGTGYLPLSYNPEGDGQGRVLTPRTIYLEPYLNRVGDDPIAILQGI